MKRTLFTALARLRNAVGITMLFVASLVFSVLLHLDTAVGKRAVANIVNQALAPLFLGRIEIRRIGSLGIHGVRGVDARIFGEDGQVLIDAHGVSARIDALKLGIAAMSGSGPLEISLQDPQVDHVDVALDGDEAPALARAFLPRSHGTPKAPSAPAPRGVRVHIPHAHIGHAWVHGRFGAVPRLDVDLAQVDASLETFGAHTRIDLHGVDAQARALPMALGAKLHAEAGLALPSRRGNVVGLWARAQGHANDVPVAAVFEIDGERLDAVAHMAPTSDIALRAALPFLPLYARTEVHAEAHGDLPRLDLTAQATVGEATFDSRGSISLTTPLRIESNTQASNVDLRVLSPEAPASRLFASATAECTLLPGGPQGRFEIEALRGTVGSNETPAARIAGTFDVPHGTGPEVHARGTIAEAGAPIRLTADLLP